MAVDRTTVVGLKEAQALFRQLPRVAQEVWTDVAVQPTAAEIARQAAGRLVPGRGYRTGQLKKAIGYSVNTQTGQAKVGIRRGFDISLPGRSARHHPTRVGHLVEFRANRPFMVPSAQAEQGNFLARCRAAGKALESEMASRGGAGSRLL